MLPRAGLSSVISVWDSDYARALPLFLAYYNRERPHGSLSDQPPLSRLKARV